jgi:light-regulated signal transduction histidine kinase (bacteriophytochrome)
LENAWKFTGKHPRARIAFGVSRQHEERAYFVRDDGAGFDPAYAAKLFGSFQRLHAVTDFEGTGIGLATVARIVHRHGGRIWAEGAVEQGATFYFTLAN